VEIAVSLIKACKKGHQDAYKSMYELTIKYCYAIVLRYVQDNEVKDVVQECYASLFTSLRNFDTRKGTFKSFFRGLIAKTCMNHNRKSHRAPMVTFPDQLVEVPIQDKELETYLQLGIDDIKELFEDMPSGYKTIFLLHVMDEFTHKEIGDLLEITPETSRSQFLRAKKWILKNIIANSKSTRYGLF